MFLQPAQSALTPIRLVSFQKISALSVIQNLHALTEVWLHPQEVAKLGTIVMEDKMEQLHHKMNAQLAITVLPTMMHQLSAPWEHINPIKDKPLA